MPGNKKFMLCSRPAQNIKIPCNPANIMYKTPAYQWLFLTFEYDCVFLNYIANYTTKLK